MGSTKNTISLGLLFHNHQPVGNFPWVFQRVYEESYLPMLEALERHAGVRLSLHYTGSLFDWLEEAHPEFLARVNALVQRNQIEIVSGGYYEPILPSIPDADKLVQIRRLNERIQRDFAVTPTGMWLAERVWEPSLPGFIRAAGIEWTIVDDIHFKSAGLEDHDLYGYYATEDQSPPLKIFATSQKLRYTIPWHPVHETIDLLRSLATSTGERILVMGDDGEKFGSWPETHQHCWGADGRSGWIDEFFNALEQNSAWLQTMPLGEYASTYAALCRIYLPTSSYIEMTEWALPPQKSYLFGKLLHRLEGKKQEQILQFMRGGFWRNFLARYPEVNNQHKKMLRVHDLVYKAGASEEHGLRHLLKSQANDTYWHGLFGGAYMPHARSAIYHHLIKAENMAAYALHGDAPWQHYEFTDFDCDTVPELLIEGNRQNLYIDPRRGGSIFEWDIRRSAHNLLCVMTRHQEGYHQTLREYEQQRRTQTAAHTAQHEEALESPHTTIRVKEEGLDRYLIVDRHRRNSLVDHFLPSGLSLANYAQARYDEQGNFIEQPYEATVSQDEQGITVTLTRNGAIRRGGALSSIPVQVTKRLFTPRDEEKLFVRYTIQNQSPSVLTTNFACEWNFNLLGGGSNDQAYYVIEGQALANHHFDSNSANLDVKAFQIGNTWLQQGLCFQLSEAATLWRFSIEMVTGSEAGFERTHQGSCATLIWPLDLKARQSWSVGIECISLSQSQLQHPQMQQSQSGSQ